MRTLLALFLSVITINAFAQKGLPKDDILQYKGQMRNISFQYFRNWILVDNAKAITLTPDKYKSYIEIHKEPLATTKSDLLKEIKEDGSEIEETTFNGLPAYKVRGTYFVFFDKTYFTIGSLKGDDQKLRDQFEQIMKSIKF